jgi:ATP-dependent DNA helicase RecG
MLRPLRFALRGTNLDVVHDLEPSLRGFVEAASTAAPLDGPARAALTELVQLVSGLDRLGRDARAARAHAIHARVVQALEGDVGAVDGGGGAPGARPRAPGSVGRTGDARSASVDRAPPLASEARVERPAEVAAEASPPVVARRLSRPAPTEERAAPAPRPSGPTSVAMSRPTTRRGSVAPEPSTEALALPMPATSPARRKRSPASTEAPARRRKAAAGADVAASSPLGRVMLSALDGVGPASAKRLEAKGLTSVLDALLWLPRRYEDRRVFTPIAEAVAGEFVQVQGRVLHAALSRAGGGRLLFEVVLGDGTGTLNLRWFRFHADGMKRRFVRDREFVVSGTLTAWGAMRQMVHPEVEDPGAPGDPSAAGIAPVYSEVDGLRPKQLRKILQDVARRFAHRVEDPLPTHLRERRGLPALASALRKAHLPETLDPGEEPDGPVRHRLVYDELLFFQLMLAQRRQAGEAQPGLVNVSPTPWPELAARMLPFPLTGAQRRALGEIVGDLGRDRPMNRLLQGDVGAGKTAVAMVAAAVVARAGRQTALLAPTEILAAQHAATSEKYLAAIGLRHALLTGSTRAKARRELLDALAAGELDVLVGTHAILEPAVRFARLGLAIVDEQHRFGVEQRGALRTKTEGLAPDVLVMTATPIPRTLALTLYGDLEVSILDERPPGRTPITTSVLRERERGQAWRQVAQALAQGRQAYVVFPLVESSEQSDLRAATEAVDEIRAQFPGHGVGLLHGRMRPDDKAQVMDEFRAGRLGVLVSTTVIEVGVDVPNATVMVIENAERFGLSQVHQLRGRVGRGVHPGSCVLIVGSGGQEAWNKLAVLERTDDGFEVAEADLEIRGPGELLGTRQSGLASLATADLVRDAHVLEQAREDAFALISADPRLARSEHEALRAELERRTRVSFGWADVG